MIIFYKQWKKELTKIYLTLFLLAMIAPISSFAADVSYDDAMKIKGRGDYVKAEQVFISLIKKDKNNSELWFELGLVQRFLNKNSEALISQKKSLEISPKNNDAKLEIARIYFGQENHDEAEILLNEILAQQPEYSDASELLSKIKSAKKSTNKEYLWQLDVGHQQSRFSRVKQDSWTIDSMQIGRWISNNTLLNFRSENVKRFKRHDQYYEAGASHIFNNRLNGSFSIGRSPNADFYPRNRINLGLEGKVIHQHKFLGDTWLTADVQKNYYKQFNITIIKPGIRYSIVNDLTIHLQHIDVISENNKYLKGWLGRLDWQTPLPKFKIFAGLANGPEVQNGVTIDTKSRFVGTAYQLTPRLTAYLAYSRDDRENSFIRKSFDATLSFKF